ncbi:MAG: NADH:flavin oxidoreductase [Ruminococcus sp.]|nr:NADH:flavin oxidoreductase [Ruminococcus sp.]
MKTIFDKTTMKNLDLKNRLFRSATWEALADSDGHFDEEIYDIYDELAAGGVGCIISGFTSVYDNDHYFGGMARLSNDGLIPEHKRLTDTVHAHGVPIIAQLAMGEYKGKEIDELTAEDIGAIRELFIKAADRAVQAGYDGVQIHAAHSFFLSRYISPAYNHRTKTPETLIIDIAKAIRDRHPDLHITMKINSSDFMFGGLDENGAMRICLSCAPYLDSIEVSGNGTSVGGIKAGVNEAYFEKFALALTEKVEIPVILVGGHRSIENMNKVLNDGKIEYLSLSRPLIREPELINRWQNGECSPAKCVSCNMCYRTPAHKCIYKLRGID